jgi:hypothetical protein
MSTREAVAKATFTPFSGGQKQAAIPVHFNPVSLQYTVTNTLKEEGSGKTKKQYVTQGTGKLTMDLIFDNTHNGQDVRVSTMKVAAFMEPDKKSSGKKKVAAILLFEWGAYKFQGMMESYKETLDFFAPNGVPLRASVNISLVQQDKIFEPGSADTGGNLTPDVVSLPGGSDQNAQGAADQGGDPGAARGLAAANAQESMRFSSGPLTVSASIQLGPPVAFATGGAGISAGLDIGISAGAGIGIGGGAGIGISGGASIGASAGAGIQIGSSASAGVSASAGAFAGLRASAQAPALSLNTDNFVPVNESLSVSIDSRASFEVGGRAGLEGSAGLSADVGATADLRARIQFEG